MKKSHTIAGSGGSYSFSKF